MGLTFGCSKTWVPHGDRHFREWELYSLKPSIIQLEAKLKAAKAAATPQNPRPVNVAPAINNGTVPYTRPWTGGPKSASYECKALSHFCWDFPKWAACKAQEATGVATQWNSMVQLCVWLSLSGMETLILVDTGANLLLLRGDQARGIMHKQGRQFIWAKCNLAL